jgi:glycosyltransferase involved in cell wall biosynthesis
MRVVIDGLPIRGDSLGIVVEHFLEGWERVDSGDEVHLVVGPDHQMQIPDWVVVHRVKFGRLASLSRLVSQSVRIPRLCRKLRADILLGVLPTTSVMPLPCPRAIIAYDLRYKIHEDHFSKKALLLRKVSYGVGFRQADAVICISDRTRDDVLRFFPRLNGRIVRTALLGADHVDNWPVNKPMHPFAIGFGRYANKNVDLVLDAWTTLCQRGQRVPLTIVGLSDLDRPRVEERIAELGLGGVVTPSPWLPIESFRERFASSSLVVFPSEFEGFGLPVAEAMRLGIPVVITPEAAMLEIAGGHATVMADLGSDSLVKAVESAQLVTEDELSAAREWAERFTWSNFAWRVRGTLASAVARADQGVRAPVRQRRRLVPQLAQGPALQPALLTAPVLRTRGGHGTARAWTMRWISVAAAATFSVTTAGAVSYALIASHPNAAPVVHQTSASSGSIGTQTPSAKPSSTTSSGSSISTATSASIPSTSHASAQRGTATTSQSQTASSPPLLTVPSITVPTVTIPPAVCQLTNTIPIPLVTLPCLAPPANVTCSCP